MKIISVGKNGQTAMILYRGKTYHCIKDGKDWVAKQGFSRQEDEEGRFVYVPSYFKLNEEVEV